MNDNDLQWMCVGLGNPGPRYSRTRHNAGFLVIDKFISLLSEGGFSFSKKHTERYELWLSLAGAGGRFLCLKPFTFMNRSGEPLQEVFSFYKVLPSRMIVFHDDIDLDFGSIRIKQGGGHGGHNGLKSIESQLGTKDFFRIRIGVGRPGTAVLNPHEQVRDWVLTEFSKAEVLTLEQVTLRAAHAAYELIKSGLSSAQNKFNS